MAKRTTLTTGKMLEVMRLLADVASLRHRPAEQASLLINGLSGLTGIEQGWLFVGRGIIAPAKPSLLPVASPKHPDPTLGRHLGEFARVAPVDSDPFLAFARVDPAITRVLPIRQAVPDAAARRRYGAMHDAMDAVGITDSVIAYNRLDAHGGFIAAALHQIGKGHGVTPQVEALLQFAMTEVGHAARRGHFAFLAASTPDDLSPRLRQVLDLVTAGKVAKEIARDLGISPYTAREHLSRLYARFGVTDRVELMTRLHAETIPPATRKRVAGGGEGG